MKWVDQQPNFSNKLRPNIRVTYYNKELFAVFIDLQKTQVGVIRGKLCVRKFGIPRKQIYLKYECNWIKGRQGIDGRNCELFEIKLRSQTRRDGLPLAYLILL